MTTTTSPATFGLGDRVVTPAGRLGVVVLLAHDLVYVEHSDGDQFAYDAGQLAAE